MSSPLVDRARRLMEQKDIALDELDELRADVLDELLPDGASLANAQLGNGLHERLLIDVLTAMSLVDPVDPAHPWTLAAALYAMGRYYEAAMAFLEAEGRFRSCAIATPMTNDEEDWAASCIEHAENCFRQADLGLSAASLGSHKSLN